MENMSVVWQLSLIHFNKRVLIKGVLLQEEPFIYNKNTSSFKNLLKVGKSYTIDTCIDSNITISFENKTIYTKTNTQGGFLELLDFIPKGEPKISLTKSGQPLKIIQTYPITFKETAGNFDVISDIDDTIVYSYTADFFKRVGTLAFTTPNKRKPIEFTQNLFEEFKKQDIRVFYISKSEGNLFNMLSTFIEHNKLPKGPLFLTPYLKFSQLFISKKNNFKRKNIRFILENSGNKKFVLLGDDSQKDMTVYTAIIKDFPDRIIKVYIRQTKHKILPRQKNMMSKLKKTNIPVTYFKATNNLDIAKELINLNL